MSRTSIFFFTSLHFKIRKHTRYVAPDCGVRACQWVFLLACVNTWTWSMVLINVGVSFCIGFAFFVPKVFFLWPLPPKIWTFLCQIKCKWPLTLCLHVSVIVCVCVCACARAMSVLSPAPSTPWMKHAKPETFTVPSLCLCRSEIH